MGIGRTWTPKEEEYLSEHYGVLSIKTLAKNLKRSENSILVRKVRLGLGRFLENGEYISYSQFLMALYGLDNVQSAYRLCKTWDGFPLRTKRVNNNSFKVVYLNDFWVWAESNKRKVDFSKMPENILGAEPDWVKRKRKIDFECRVKTSPWTPAEDAKLGRMLKKYQYTYTDIAAELNRSEGAVKRRICDLHLPERPIKVENRSWTQEETVKLVFMYEEGYSFEKIGQELNRSALCCRGKMERIENPTYFIRENRRQREYGKV